MDGVVKQFPETIRAMEEGSDSCETDFECIHISLSKVVYIQAHQVDRFVKRMSQAFSKFQR